MKSNVSTSEIRAIVSRQKSAKASRAAAAMAGKGKGK